MRTKKSAQPPHQTTLTSSTQAALGAPPEDNAGALPDGAGKPPAPPPWLLEEVASAIEYHSKRGARACCGSVENGACRFFTGWWSMLEKDRNNVKPWRESFLKLCAAGGKA